jgi:hypothetical protein
MLLNARCVGIDTCSAPQARVKGFRNLRKTFGWLGDPDLDRFSAGRLVNEGSRQKSRWAQLGALQAVGRVTKTFRNIVDELEFPL